MLSISPLVRVYVAPGATDMRKGCDGLAEVVRGAVGGDPLSGHLFLFCNRRRDRLRALLWDGSGFWLLGKRLERGTFSWPSPAEGQRSIELSQAELAMLLWGLDAERLTPRRWYRREVAAEPRPAPAAALPG